MCCFVQIPEDLHFVLRMRHTFESLGYQSGFFLSQLFSSTRTTNPTLSQPSKPFPPGQAPTTSTPIYNWSQRPIPPPPSTTFHSAAAQMGLHTKEEPHLFLLPNATNSHIDMVTDHDNELKWPHGVSFFNALTGRPEESKLLFGMDALGSKVPQHHHFPAAGNSSSNGEMGYEAPTLNGGENMVTTSNPSEYLSLESHSNSVRKMEHKFKRSFTLPARMASPATSSSLNIQRIHHPMEDYRNSEAGIYADLMGSTYME